MHKAVEKKLDELEAEGIFTPIAVCDWESPLVIVPKPDGGVCLCIDYKSGVKAGFVSAGTLISGIDNVLHSLRNSRYFCKLDLYQAYLHFQVDEETNRI